MGMFDFASAGFNLIGNVLGGYAQNEGARDARNDVLNANNNAIAEQRRQFDLTRSDYMPWMEAGKESLSQLTDEMGRSVTAQDVMSDPGYQFGMDEGLKALERRIAAMGGRVSGSALKAATRYGNDYATGGYNAAYQRRQDRLNRLQSLAGMGQTATGSSAAAGSNAANAISGILQDSGTARAAYSLNRGNMWANNFNAMADFGAQAYGGGGSRGGPAGGSGIRLPNFFG